MRITMIGILAAIILMSLIGCATPSATTQNLSDEDYLNARPSSVPIEMKMGIGILKLEDTDLSVSAEQARTLLPLWKALKSLNTDTNTTAEEITALNRQIEESLTSDQIQAVNEMTWTGDEIRQLMQKFGGMQQAAGPGTASTEAASNGRTGEGFPGGGFPGGGPGGGGMGGPPMGGGGMMVGPGGAGMENPAASRTAVPGQAERRQAAGMNLMFVEPVIRLLESKITSP